jgi:DNA polymerase I-like protein with 3'-5' exonuclease and polymerase domains
MTTYAIDFESTYEEGRDIKSLGPSAYLAHPQTEIYLVSIMGTDGHSFVGEPQDYPHWAEIAKGEWVAHNRTFDSLCLAELIKRGVIPHIAPKAWHCSADAAAYHGIRRDLAGAYLAEFGKRPRKDVRTEMKGKTLAEMKSSPAFWQSCLDYALADSVHCLQLWEKLGPLIPYEEQYASWHTTVMCSRGIGIDKVALAEARRTIELEWQIIQMHIPWYWDCEEDDEVEILSTKRLAAYCYTIGIEPPKSTAKGSAEFDAWIAKYGVTVPAVEALGKYRTINRVRQQLLRMERGAVGDRFPYGMKYFGAHTGRWSGDTGYNMQALPREALGGVDIRSLFVPAPGKRFIIADFAQIEARVLCWLIGDRKMLQAMETSDVYEAHARATMGYTDPRPMKEGDPARRQLAKARVLGLGFGCGEEKFQSMAKKLADLDLTPEECKETVADYRKNNPLVTELWKKLNSGLIQSLGEDLEVPMRSGRVLHYRRVLQREDNDDKGKQRLTPWGAPAFDYVAEAQGRVRKFYGGLLTENLVQATARDLLRDAIREIEQAGIPVVLHVHDEVVCEVDAGDVEQAAALVQWVMRGGSKWSKGLPLDASCEIADCYLK